MWNDEKDYIMRMIQENSKKLDMMEYGMNFNGYAISSIRWKRKN